MFASLNPGHVGIHCGFRDGLALAARHGFDGYDAQLQTLHDEVTRHGAAAVQDLFASHRLLVGAWNLPFMPYRVSEEEWRSWLVKLPPMLASAQAVGALRAGMWIMPGSDEYDYQANFVFHVTRFQPIARMLADHGVRLGLEFIGPETVAKKFRHPFIRSVGETVELGKVIAPNCGLLVDVWHWHCAGGTRADFSHFSRQSLVHIHVDDAPVGVPLSELNDARRRLPCSTGVIDIDGFMQALGDAGYDGPVTAEPFDPSVSCLPSEEAAARTARATKEAVSRAQRAVNS